MPCADRSGVNALTATLFVDSGRGLARTGSAPGTSKGSKGKKPRRGSVWASLVSFGRSTEGSGRTTESSERSELSERSNFEAPQDVLTVVTEPAITDDDSDGGDVEAKGEDTITAAGSMTMWGGSVKPRLYIPVTSASSKASRMLEMLQEGDTVRLDDGSVTKECVTLIVEDENSTWAYDGALTCRSRWHARCCRRTDYAHARGGVCSCRYKCTPLRWRMRWWWDCGCARRCRDSCCRRGRGGGSGGGGSRRGGSSKGGSGRAGYALGPKGKLSGHLPSLHHAARASHRKRAGGGTTGGAGAGVSARAGVRRWCGCWCCGVDTYLASKGQGGDAGMPHYHDNLGDGRHTRRCRVVIGGDIAGAEVVELPTSVWLRYWTAYVGVCVAVCLRGCAVWLCVGGCVRVAVCGCVCAWVLGCRKCCNGNHAVLRWCQGAVPELDWYVVEVASEPPVQAPPHTTVGRRHRQAVATKRGCFR